MLSLPLFFFSAIFRHYEADAAGLRHAVFRHYFRRHSDASHAIADDRRFTPLRYFRFRCQI